MNNGIFVQCVIIWHAALFAIIFSFKRSLLRKKGAIKGPVAPIKIELNPLIAPTGIKEDICFSFFDPSSRNVFDYFLKFFEIK